MSVTSLQEYRDKLAGINPDKFVGSILWFSIMGATTRDALGVRGSTPVRVQHDTLEAWFTELNLDPAYIPAKIKRVDAFRTATSEMKGVSYPLADGTTAELLIREVDTNRDFVLRHVMREIKDVKAQRLSYDHVATLKWFRSTPGNTKTLEHYRSTVLRGVSDADRPHIEALLEALQTRFDDLCVNLQSQALRGMVRNYITGLNAIAVKPSGGVYFVHKSRQDTLDRLATLVGRLGPNCGIHQMPLLDTIDQREMLTEAFEVEVEDECRKLLVEIAGVNARGQASGDHSVLARTYAALHSRYTEIVERSEEYTRVLGLTQDRGAAALELALDSVMDLATRVSR